MSLADFDLSRYSSAAHGNVSHVGEFTSSASAMEVDSDADADGDVFLSDADAGVVARDEGSADLKEAYEFGGDADADMDTGGGDFDTSFNESFDSTSDIPEFSEVRAVPCCAVCCATSLIELHQSAVKSAPPWAAGVGYRLIEGVDLDKRVHRLSSKRADVFNRRSQRLRTSCARLSLKS